MIMIRIHPGLLRWVALGGLGALAACGSPPGAPAASADPAAPAGLEQPAPRNDLMLLIRMQMETGARLP